MLLNPSLNSTPAPSTVSGTGRQARRCRHQRNSSKRPGPGCAGVEPHSSEIVVTQQPADTLEEHADLQGLLGHPDIVILADRDDTRLAQQDWPHARTRGIGEHQHRFVHIAAGERFYTGT